MKGDIEWLWKSSDCDLWIVWRDRQNRKVCNQWNKNKDGSLLWSSAAVSVQDVSYGSLLWSSAAVSVQDVSYVPVHQVTSHNLPGG